MKRTALLLAVLLIVSTFALAHGGEKHVMGVVKAISATSITVETKDKKIVEIAVSAATQFEKSGKPAKVADLKTGDRVVVHATEKNEKLTAETVRFGAMKMSGMENAQKEVK